MTFHRKKYDESLRQKYLQNPGRENRRRRKEANDAARGPRIPSARIKRDARRAAEKKRVAREIKDYS